MHGLPFLDLEALNSSHLLSSPHTHLAPTVPPCLKHHIKLPRDLCTFSLPELFFLEVTFIAFKFLFKCHLISDVTDHSMSKAKPSAQSSPFPLPDFTLPHSAYHLTLHFCICQLSLHTTGFGPWRQGLGVCYSLPYSQQVDQRLALDLDFLKNLLNK